MENSNNNLKKADNALLIKNSYKFGAYLAALYIIIMLIRYVLNIENNSFESIIGSIILIVGIYIGIKHFRDKLNGGFISYGKSFKSGFLISVFTALILTLFSYIFFKYFDPNEIEKLKSLSERKMLEKGIDEDTVEQALSIQSLFFTPFYIAIIQFFSILLTGTIVSLLLSLILKRENKSFDAFFDNKD